MSFYDLDDMNYWADQDGKEDELEELRALYGDDYEPEGPDPSLSAAERSPSLMKQ